ncbi:dnaJ homolog subfamily C member 17 [Harmonia axyridis]|uniref:dnaJ homolog subfamily C member 17 n=1 Tax=Harmonia axyridis TaxID=115357 RepID=UPI001E276308|nr:dnaJ homolog subfamily C member 17 [Harmonia axyridis]
MDSSTLEGLDFDLYETLEIEPSCSINDIKKAYRKKALLCHPDKNPDNPNAAVEFHKLTRILAILSDEKVRESYDKVLRGRKEAALRHKELDNKRKKFKEDLESRERFANSQKDKKKSEQEEIERLREEGSQALQEEVRNVTNKIRKEHGQEDPLDASKYRIKIKWKAAKNDESNGGYTKDMILKFLSKYGDVNVLVLSAKKKGSAMVEFKTKSAAEMAMNCEKGLSINPLTLEWVTAPPPSTFRGLEFLIKGTEFEGMTMEQLTKPDIRKRFIEKMILDKFK